MTAILTDIISSIIPIIDFQKSVKVLNTTIMIVAFLFVYQGESMSGSCWWARRREKEMQRSGTCSGPMPFIVMCRHPATAWTGDSCYLQTRDPIHRPGSISLSGVCIAHCERHSPAAAGPHILVAAYPQRRRRHRTPAPPPQHRFMDEGG